MAVGAVTVKPNVDTFGADQLNPNEVNETQQKETYFSHLYFSIYAGAVVAFGYLSALCVNSNSFIPDRYGYVATFIICAVALAVPMVILIACNPPNVCK